jgi:uncharacterized Zn finger protein
MLAELLNREVLRELAGERAFERGADYFADGHVVGLREENGAITELLGAATRGSGPPTSRGSRVMRSEGVIR